MGYDDLYPLDEDIAPFDLGAAPPAPMSAPTAQQQGGGRMQALAPLLAVLPALMSKGGPGAAAAVMRGYQRAQLQKQQQGQQQFQNDRLMRGEQRQAALDQEAIRQHRADEAYRQGQQREALMREFTGALQNEGVSDPISVQGLLDLYNQRASQLGMRSGVLDSAAQQIAGPSVLEKRAANKYIKKLESTYGQDWALKVGAASFHVPGIPDPVDPMTGQARGLSMNELLQKSGITMDGLPAKPITDKPPTPGSFEDYLGASPERQREIEGARARYGLADDRPRTEPRQRFSVQPITNPDGTTGLVRVNLDTGETTRVDLPTGAGSGLASDTQRLSRAYLDRTSASDVTAQTFEQSLLGLGDQLDVQLPNLIRSEQGQRYRQAKDEFINASLRRESGAAIQPSEYTRFDKIYFVMPGDTFATIRQKQAARKRVIDGFRVAAGNLGVAGQDATVPPASRYQKYLESKGQPK